MFKVKAWRICLLKFFIIDQCMDHVLPDMGISIKPETVPSLSQRYSSNPQLSDF